ncbi:MAG: hypothetical protein JSU79_10850 [Dehalococcoidales bacterium]|nr:MAG: hypothetical protein JSU79_10850 [Dehalococcoidales bacterium]
MASYKIIQIVASQSTPDKEEEFNRWYTDVHVPMFFGFDGLKQAGRYRCIGDAGDNARYLAIYEFEDEEALAAFPKSEAFAEAVKDFEERKEAVGFEIKWAGSYELIKSWSRE